MSFQSAINKEVFTPRDERMLVAVEVRRRGKKRLPFLPTGGKGEYATFICLSVTNKKPPQLLITKVKRFSGTSSFISRSQWTMQQLRQVNGINPNKDCPEFDLVFDNTVDQWLASSAAEKCIFIQILYHACQTYGEGKMTSLSKVDMVARQRRMSLSPQDLRTGTSNEPLVSPGVRSRSLQARRKSYAPPRQTEFVNCQSKLTGEACTMNLVIYRCKAFFNRLKKRMDTNKGRPMNRGKETGRGTAQRGQRPLGGTGGSVVQRANMALRERGEKLSRAEDRTVDLMHKAQQLADTAHKVLALKRSKKM